MPPDVEDLTWYKFYFIDLEDDKKEESDDTR